MIILDTTPREYLHVFPNGYTCFNTVEFNELNKNKCDNVKYLLFRDSKIRLGLIAGVKSGILQSPFSAPYGGFSYLDNKLQIDKIDEALFCLDKYIKDINIDSIKFILPPLIYNQSFISKCVSSLIRNGYMQDYVDLNYSFNTNHFSNKYIEETLQSNTRRNLKIAQNNCFFFKKTSSQQEIVDAYNIIKQNRLSRGYPLKMTLDQVLATLSVIKNDSFLLYLENTLVASAIIFHINPKTVQIIYWGDLPEYSDKKTMNLLSYKIFEYYKNNNITLIDIGPSTENGNPNYGLCEFKESIGCDVSLKYTFSKKI